MEVQRLGVLFVDRARMIKYKTRTGKYLSHRQIHYCNRINAHGEIIGGDTNTLFFIHRANLLWGVDDEEEEEMVGDSSSLTSIKVTTWANFA